MRIFIALLFSNKNKDIINDIKDIVKRYSNKGNFTNYNNLHLTIKYIGNTSYEQLKNISNKLSKIKFNKFDYYTTNLNYFKKGKNQKIIYLEIKRSKLLDDLYKNVVDKLNEMDILFENNNYIPHITLGRKVVIDNELDLLNRKIKEIKLTARKISIMESKRVDNKLVYEELYSIPLL